MRPKLIGENTILLRLLAACCSARSLFLIANHFENCLFCIFNENKLMIASEKSAKRWCSKRGKNTPYNFSKLSCRWISSIPRSSLYFATSHARRTHKRACVSECLKRTQKDIPNPLNRPLLSPQPPFLRTWRQKRPEERGFKL